MLAKDLFVNQPSKKNEYWKYTDMSFLDLEINEKSSYSLKTSLNRINDIHDDNDNFYELNKSVEKESYIVKHNESFEIIFFKGLIIKNISFIVSESTMTVLDLDFKSNNSDDKFIGLLKMNFIIDGILTLNINSSVNRDYLLEDFNFILNEGAQLIVNYVAKGITMNKSVIRSYQNNDSKLDINFRTMLLNNENTDLSIVSQIEGKNCYLNHNVKAVLNHKSTFSCLGEINILRNADNAEANHYNSTLALSEDIRINSRPVLKINNGNIKCSHGSPSSYIQDEDIFYMCSRGLNKKEAYKMYVTSFLNTESSIIKDIIQIGV